jgi:hypothetical protein
MTIINTRIPITSPPEKCCYVEVFYKNDPSRCRRLFYDAGKKQFLTKRGRNRTSQISHWAVEGKRGAHEFHTAIQNLKCTCPKCNKPDKALQS